MDAEDVLSARRCEMVRQQIVQRGLRTPSLLEALRAVPRHRFVPQSYLEQAYNDCPLPIGQGQTISQPYIVAAMIDLLQLGGEERVLEVGCGSGYQAAVLGRMAREVHSIELLPGLASRAASILRELDVENVYVHLGDGGLGWPQAAPYQGILVAAAAPAAPPVLLAQLAEGGRLVVPVGPKGKQELQVWKRCAGELRKKTIFQVSFVPLRGAAGWPVAAW